MTLRDTLAARMVGEAVIMGIGNPLRGDDGAGCLVARRVRRRGGVRVIEAEDVPESFAGQVIAFHPRVIVLIDSVDLGAPPGSVSLLEKEDIKDYFPTTHRMPLAMLMEFLEQEAGAHTFLLAIQPRQFGFAVPMSAEVSVSASLLAETLNEVILARSCEPKRQATAREHRKGSFEC